MTSTPYHVRITPTALRQMHSQSNKQQKLLIKFIEALAINPRPPGVKKIEGMTGLYTQDVTHGRLVYKVEEQEVLLLLIK